MRFELGGSGMTYEEVMKKAKSEIGPYCKVCPQCNGKACKNQMPGPGAKGVGDVAIRNYDAWKDIRINMDTICENVIPTVKPWNIETIREKMDMVQDCGAKMVAMDIDAAGLPFLKNLNPPAGSKTVEQLGEIVNAAGIPFIVKGIMTVSGAKKAFDAGASAIVVSNHGGRVLDQTPATAEVLERIVEWNQGRMKIFVDGGIRQGTDIFKALAMGADAVLIARPFVQVVYGGAEEGVKLYIEKLAAELSDTMAMCGAASIKDINRSMLYRPM